MKLEIKLDSFLNKKVTVTQIKGGSKLNDRQKGNLIGLGLRGIGSSVSLDCSQPVLGMIRKIAHIVKISLA
jgi:large subunit ribosomal protein L30